MLRRHVRGPHAVLRRDTGPHPRGRRRGRGAGPLVRAGESELLARARPGPDRAPAHAVLNLGLAALVGILVARREQPDGHGARAGPREHGRGRPHDAVRRDRDRRPLLRPAHPRRSVRRATHDAAPRRALRTRCRECSTSRSGRRSRPCAASRKRHPVGPSLSIATPRRVRCAGPLHWLGDRLHGIARLDRRPCSRSCLGSSGSRSRSS